DGSNEVTIYVGLFGDMHGDLGEKPKDYIAKFHRLAIQAVLPEVFLFIPKTNFRLGQTTRATVGTLDIAPTQRNVALGIHYLQRNGGYEPNSLDGISFPAEVIIPAGERVAQFDLGFDWGPHGNSSSVAALTATLDANVGLSVPLIFDAKWLVPVNAHIFG